MGLGLRGGMGPPERMALRQRIALRAKLLVFGNDCHNPAGPGGGRFCDADGNPSADWSAWEEAQKTAVENVSSQHRGKFWLNADGKFVRPPGKVQVHIAVIPKELVTARGPDYKAFAHATKAIRIVVSPVESTVHIWENPNAAQRDSLAQLLRQTTVLQGDRDNGTSLTIKYLNNSAEDHFGSGLTQVVRFVRGEGEPGQKLVEFKLTDAEREAKYKLSEFTILPTWDYVPYLPEVDDFPEDDPEFVQFREDMRLQGEEYRRTHSEFANTCCREKANGEYCTCGGKEGRVARKLVEGIQKRGGATLDPRTGKRLEKGFAVGGIVDAVRVGTSSLQSEKGRQEARNDIRKWMIEQAKKGAFDHPDFKVGAWVDGGEAWIEVAQSVSSREKAIKLGENRNQWSVGDIVAIRKSQATTGEKFLDTSGKVPGHDPGVFIPEASPLEEGSDGRYKLRRNLL